MIIIRKKYSVISIIVMKHLCQVLVPPKCRGNAREQRISIIFLYSYECVEPRFKATYDQEYQDTDSCALGAHSTLWRFGP